MPRVQYKTYGSRRVQVSGKWLVILNEADHDEVRFVVTSGHRTFEEQAELVRLKGVWSPTNRTGAARPSHNAPHIWTDRPNHALDISTTDGGEARFDAWVSKQGVGIDWLNTVPGEAWHGQIERDDFERLYRKCAARQRRRRQRAKKVKPKKAPPRPKHDPKDVALAKKLKERGAEFAIEIIEEARREKVPLAWALALIDQETTFRNIFGADKSSRQLEELHHKPVTKARVQRLIKHVESGGHSNGVGPAQLTSIGYIKRAEKLGGAHLPRLNIRVGYQVLNEKTGREYVLHAWRYNGNLGYQTQIMAKRTKWARVLREIGT